MKKIFFLVFLSVLISGCSMVSVLKLSLTGNYKPLIIKWPNVVQQTNVPASSQGVVITAPRGMWLDIVKTSGYGTTAFVYGMPPGGTFFIPADANLQYGETIVLTVRGRDSQGNLLGVTSRSFSFSNTGAYSYNQYWNVEGGELR